MSDEAGAPGLVLGEGTGVNGPAQPLQQMLACCWERANPGAGAFGSQSAGGPAFIHPFIHSPVRHARCRARTRDPGIESRISTRGAAGCLAFDGDQQGMGCASWIGAGLSGGLGEAALEL